MNDQALPHKLAAILYADVEGYSRLTGADEVGTHRTLSAYLDLFTETIKAHRGEVKHYAGDAILADFTTVSDALNCAVAFQKTMKDKNETLAPDKRVQFRIGLNLGEVIVDRGEVYGNGVNVAARLETLAEPGGICISGATHDAIGNKLPLLYDDLGEHTVKNIDKPVRAYRVNFTGEKSPIKQVSATSSKSTTRKSIAWIAALVAIVAAIGLWQFGTKRVVLPSTTHATDAVFAMPTGLPIAVLPFTNMSGDPKEDYFSDGLTEDIITELARFKDLYVLARNTTFQYKGKAIDVPEVGKKLGVKYVLEGSVRRAGDQVRIAAQLIDVGNGAHIWAEKYDRPMTDIFKTHDEIASKIVAAIAAGNGGALNIAEQRAVARKQPNDLKAYDLVLQAAGMVWNPAGYKIAKTQLEQAIALDPNYARARADYAWLLLVGWIFRLEETTAPPAELKANAIKAAILDLSDYRSRRAAAWGHFFDHELQKFDNEATAAMSFAPNDALVLAELGTALTMSGQWERGVKLVTKANALNAESAAGWYHTALFYDYFRQGQYQRALEAVQGHPNQEMVETQQKYIPVYVELGNIDKAREHWNKCVELDPKWSIERMKEILVLWNFPKDFSQRYLESFSKAGYR
jgi:adenylate cyclase